MITSGARDARQQVIREAIREARAARCEDSRWCECGHTAAEHLIRLSDGATFHCCDEECDCEQYAEVPRQAVTP